MFFWSIPYKKVPYEIVVAINSLIEMPGVRNFDNMATSTVKFESHNEVFW